MNGEANNLTCSPFYYEFKSRHDDRLQMEAFYALATACTFVGNSPVTGEFPSQRASNADFHVSLVWVHISCQSNSPMTADLRLHDVHVTSW